MLLKPLITFCLLFNTGSTGSSNPLSTIGTSILGSVAGALTGALTGAITNSIGGSSQPSQQQTQTQTQQSGGGVSFPSTISGATQTASLDCYKNPSTCITL